ncbi:Dual specificity protein phosphatase 12-like isoform X1 [Mycena venus]|uniref:protein-tyrosine-phosphatase n=1 Tax=Mycena venus TaxID=2733690 RepID=A0A8H6YS39_9AGAR|nr:Dual specificity protein phosphatase 12-like isoform X1 [Mycena venus]
MSSTGPRSQRMDKAIIRGPMDVSPLSDDVTEILPNLFLGSEAGARNLEMLRKRGITHILTVMVDPVPRGATAAEDGFRRMQIPVQDWPDQELMTYFKDANNFIDAARVTAQEAVLVHCYQGVSRSATIVAAYLMASHPPLHDDDSAALAFLRARRPIVHPNSGFLAQLALYGRCGCDLDAHPTAVEAWRAGAGADAHMARGSGETWGLDGGG